MIDQETVQKFIELRTQGVPFARIAGQLGVAKSTLILWTLERNGDAGKAGWFVAHFLFPSREAPP